MTDTRSPDEIEHEINAERGRMKETIGALEDRMSVGALVDRATEMFSSSGGAGAAQGVGRAVRGNPGAIALIGLGVAWLAMSGRGEHGENGHARRGARPLYDDPYEGPWIDDDLDEHFAAGPMSTASRGRRERVSDALADRTERAGEMGRRFRQGAGSRAESVRRRAGANARAAGAGAREAGRRVRSGADEARHRAESFFDDNPLAAGALAFAAGAALGAFSPNTRYEDRTFGTHAEAARREAWRRAEDGMDRGRRAAEAAADSVGEDVKSATDRENREMVGAEARSSAERAAEAAREEARRGSHETGGATA